MERGGAQGGNNGYSDVVVVVDDDDDEDAAAADDDDDDDDIVQYCVAFAGRKKHTETLTCCSNNVQVEPMIGENPGTVLPSGNQTWLAGKWTTVIFLLNTSIHRASSIARFD